jgi:hypothetical protein
VLLERDLGDVGPPLFLVGVVDEPLSWVDRDADVQQRVVGRVEAVQRE